ncbi:hypothetical protein RSO41_02620 [Halomonas sp. I1]|uniref:hypothetical protein n=1 Tax=Halomonas sp. I1 TaxID=393536 RepID=UPI0028DDA54E|nr:hypothetical protein [Halomonas sp. I1]MDT8893538.1 hypothetical protein [Halomonas sp. I1]
MRFATLGPDDSNHAMILRRYLAERGLENASITLVDDFTSAFESLVAKRLDYVLQVTAHPAHADCVGHYMHRAFPVDSFIAASRPLAIIARRDRPRPRSLALQPATRHYADLADWPAQRDMPTIVAVAEAVLTGEVDAGLMAEEMAERHPDTLYRCQSLGAALDTWVLFGHQPLDRGPMLWPEAPIADRFHDDQ